MMFFAIFGELQPNPSCIFINLLQNQTMITVTICCDELPKKSAEPSPLFRSSKFTQNKIFKYI